MLVQGEPDSFVDRFTRWKVIMVEAVLLVLSTFPLTPGFETGLTFGSVFYTPPLYPVLVISCLVCGALFLIIIPILLRSILGLPAIELTPLEMRLHAFSSKGIKRGDILRVGEPKFGSVRLTLRGSRHISVPVWFYRNGGYILNALRESEKANETLEA